MVTEEGLKGKVASILNDRELAINLGAEDGVRFGVRFRVVEPETTITDPDSGRELGILQRDKIMVKVVEVYPRYCVAQTYETYTFPTPYPWSALGSLGVPSRVTRVKTLLGKKERGDLSWDERGALVSVGDSVVMLVEEESRQRSA